VSKALAGRALRNVDDPLTMNGFANQLLPPKRCRDVGEIGHDAVEIITANFRHSQSGDGTDRMIHSVEDEEIEIAKVTRHDEVDNLGSSIFQRAITGPPSVENEVQERWGGTLADEIASWRDRANRLTTEAR